MEDAQREEREREYWSAFQVFAYEIKRMSGILKSGSN
jgi:hypothetical protein